MAQCRTCRARIEWLVMAVSGRRIPLDVEPVANGNLVVVDGCARAYTDEDAQAGRPRRVSHFATCPDAEQHRQRYVAPVSKRASRRPT